MDALISLIHHLFFCSYCSKLIIFNSCTYLLLLWEFPKYLGSLHRRFFFARMDNFIAFIKFRWQISILCRSICCMMIYPEYSLSWFQWFKKLLLSGLSFISLAPHLLSHLLLKISVLNFHHYKLVGLCFGLPSKCHYFLLLLVIQIH